MLGNTWKMTKKIFLE